MGKREIFRNTEKGNCVNSTVGVMAKRGSGSGSALYWLSGSGSELFRLSGSGSALFWLSGSGSALFLLSDLDPQRKLNSMPNSRDQGLSYYFRWMVEGSGSVQMKTDPNPGGPKTYGSSGSESTTLHYTDRWCNRQCQKLYLEFRKLTFETCYFLLQ